MLVVLTAVAGLLGCTSPESAASKVALAYDSIPLADFETAWDYACADDQAAKDKAELAELKDNEFIKGLLDAEQLFEIERKVVSSVLEVDGSVSVTISRSTPEGSSTETLSVEPTDAGWCISTGWAEDASYQLTGDQVAALADEASDLIDSWSFSDAAAKIGEANQLLSTVPEGHFARVVPESRIEIVANKLAVNQEGWIGGRWRTTKDEVDPMTDQRNVVVMLESQDGIPNILGTPEPVRIIARCHQAAFDVYVSTDSMLDADWRYNTVRGRYRIDKDAPRDFRGSRSTDYHAVFLKDPSSWARRIVELDGRTLVLELPVYNKQPQAVTFDLEASAQAMQHPMEACGIKL